MKIFNIGALELLFIVLLAFIVLGPDKAIKAAGDVARLIRNMTKSAFWHDLVSTSKEIQSIPKKLMDDANLQATIEDLDRSLGKTNRTILESQKMIDQVDNSNKESLKKDQIDPKNSGKS